MTRTFQPVAERDGSLWPLLAASILGIQGLSTLFYATFLPTPLTAAGVAVPVLGTVPYLWIVVGTIALVSGAGVAARLSWARYLGALSAASATTPSSRMCRDSSASASSTRREPSTNSTRRCSTITGSPPSARLSRVFDSG